MVGLTVCWFRTSGQDVSRHRDTMSQVIGTARASAMLGHAELTSKARLVITAVLVEHRPVAEVAAALRRLPGLDLQAHGPLPSRGRGRVRAPLTATRRPHPTATPAEIVDLILELRKKLTDAGLDAGADTIAWHLDTTTTDTRVPGHHQPPPDPRRHWSPRTRRSDPSPPTSASKPSMPNETWQSDFTHYRLTRPDGRPGADVEIITWLDDHSRYALHVTAHQPGHRPDRADHLPPSR